MTNILTFHLVRHGPVFNPDQLWYGRDVDFDMTSDKVVAYFNHLAAVLPTDPKDTLILSSDYPRAHEMIRAVLKTVGSDPIPNIIIDPEFGEQKYGIMEGMKGADAKQHPQLVSYFADMWQNPPEGGESMQMLQKRIGARLDTIAETTPHTIKNVIVAGHGGGGMAAFAHATGQRMIDVFRERSGENVPSFSYMSRLELKYDRNDHKWLSAYEYHSGLPKQSLV